MTIAPTASGLEAHLAGDLAAALGGDVGGRRVAVWGASASGARVCAALESIAPAALLVVDTSAARQAQGVDGRPVAAPSALARFRPDLVVIASTSPEATADIRDTAAELCPGAAVRSLLDLMPSRGLDESVVHLSVERPREGERVHRRLAVQGWAAGGSGISTVEAFLADRPVGCLAFGLPRPDVAATLGATRGATTAGFVDVIDLHGVPAGSHRLRFVAHAAGGATACVERHVVLASPRARVGESCAFCGAPHITDLTRAVNDFTVARCGACGGASVVPRPSVEDCRDWYNDPGVYATIARARRQAMESPVHPDADVLGPLLREFVADPRPRLLEIGCANGRLLNGLRAQGFETTGLEVSSESAAVARDVFRLDVRTGMLDEHRFDVPFDAIVARHVIEHVPDPGAELERIRGLLRPGGVLLLVTPNVDSLASCILRERWEWFIPPLHVHYFTAQALERLAGRVGFSTRRLQTRRGDARPLRAELARWAGPLRARGEWARSLACRRLGPLARLSDARGATLSPSLWHEELVAVLEAR